MEEYEEPANLKLLCDVCKKDYINDMYETQEFIHIKSFCGYGSIFGDGDIIEIDICQHCLKEKLGKYLRITNNF